MPLTLPIAGKFAPIGVEGAPLPLKNKIIYRLNYFTRGAFANNKTYLIFYILFIFRFQAVVTRHACPFTSRGHSLVKACSNVRENNRHKHLHLDTSAEQS